MFINLEFNGDYLINENIIIPKDYYTDSEVKDIKDLNVNGRLYYDNGDESRGEFIIEGKLILEDSISLDEVEYPFYIEYDDILEENLKKDQNKLDLFEFLWENIVLEIPLKFTKVDDLSEFHGNGWKLISEEEISNGDNPFSDLLKNFDKKE